MSISDLLQTHSSSHVTRQGNVVAYTLAQRVGLSFPLVVRIWKMFYQRFLIFVVADFLVN